jgi:hypothetical protein
MHKSLALVRLASLFALSATSLLMATAPVAQAETKVSADLHSSTDADHVVGNGGNTVGITESGKLPGILGTAVASASIGYAGDKAVGSYNFEMGANDFEPQGSQGLHVHPHLRISTDWTHSFASNQITPGVTLATPKLALTLDARTPGILGLIGYGGVIVDRTNMDELEAAGLAIQGAAKLGQKTTLRLRGETDLLKGHSGGENRVSPQDGTYRSVSASLARKLGQHWEIKGEAIAEQAKYSELKTSVDGALSQQAVDTTGVTFSAGAAYTFK